MSKSHYKYERMITGGEILFKGRRRSKHQKDVNLSGKETLVGRDSGECFGQNETTNEDSHYGKLSGERTGIP